MDFISNLFYLIGLGYLANTTLFILSRIKLFIVCSRLYLAIF